MSNAVRSVPGWLADLIQTLELEQARLVTVDDIHRAQPNLDRAVARWAITDLVRRGWLRPIDVQGTYEFIPGAAAGPYPSGDPWLVLRAVLAHRPSAFHVGANSAAWLLGYAQRSPEPHIVVTTPEIRVPRSLKAAYKVLATSPAPAQGSVDGLPVPTPTELFAEVAQLAPRLKLDAARGWLCRLIADTSPTEIAQVLSERGIATRARAGYLADVCGAEAHAAAIASLGPIEQGPFYTGSPRTKGSYSSRWRVYDTGKVNGP